MEKKIWGNAMWNTMHCVALGYPNNPSFQDKVNYKNYYQSLYKIIPCQECSVHYKKNFENNPIDPYLTSRDKLFEWTVLMHNIVNKMLKKKVFSKSEAMKELYSLAGKKQLKVNYVIFLLVAVILLLYVLYIKN